MGMTIKQYDRAQFWKCLEAYKLALESGDSHAIVIMSLAIHQALGGVPKRYKTFVNEVFRNYYKRS